MAAVRRRPDSSPSMSLSPLLLTVAALALVSFGLARRRALIAVDGRIGELHSLPGYYGFYAALWCGLPGIVLALGWVFGASWLLDQATLASLPAGAAGGGEGEATLFLNEVRNIADGNVSSGLGGELAEATAARYVEMRQRGGLVAVGLTLLLRGRTLRLPR